MPGQSACYCWLGSCLHPEFEGNVTGGYGLALCYFQRAWKRRLVAHDVNGGQRELRIDSLWSDTGCGESGGVSGLCRGAVDSRLPVRPDGHIPMGFPDVFSRKHRGDDGYPDGESSFCPNKIIPEEPVLTLRDSSWRSE